MNKMLFWSLFFSLALGGITALFLWFWLKKDEDVEEIKYQLFLDEEREE